MLVQVNSSGLENNMSTILALLFALLSFESFEDNSSVVKFAAYPIYNSCNGAICRNLPPLPEVDSPFRYTGETPVIVRKPHAPIAQYRNTSPVFEWFIVPE